MKQTDSDLLPSSFPGSQRLCNDIIVEVLERHIQAMGVQGNVGLLLLRKAISSRNIKLWTKSQLMNISQTLRQYPPRATFIKALWMCIGGSGEPIQYRFLTPDYPHQWPPRAWANISSWNDVTSVRGLLEIAAPSMERLTIQGHQTGFNSTTIFQSLHLPHITHLELSSVPRDAMCGVALPYLTHLRLVIEVVFDHSPEVAQRLLDFPSLTHLYLSLHGHCLDIYHFIRHLETPATVRALAVETNMGQQTAMEFQDLWSFDVHPRLVFIVDEQCAQTISRGLEPEEWEKLKQRFCLFPKNEWLVEQLTDFMLVKSGGRSNIWKDIEEKVTQNWSDFDKEFEGYEVQKQEFLAEATNFQSTVDISGDDLAYLTSLSRSSFVQVTYDDFVKLHYSHTMTNRTSQGKASRTTAEEAPSSRRKAPQCLKCRRPRKGHPRSGCPFVDGEAHAALDTVIEAFGTMDISGADGNGYATKQMAKGVMQVPQNKSVPSSSDGSFPSSTTAEDPTSGHDEDATHTGTSPTEESHRQFLSQLRTLTAVNEYVITANSARDINPPDGLYVRIIPADTRFEKSILIVGEVETEVEKAYRRRLSERESADTSTDGHGVGSLAAVAGGALVGAIATFTGFAFT
ncbi:hypothetical protein VNI00_013513 [Paramarasmius palmivorus]|uniref:Uncharacterized protein n=1 Tax=Paramarasmius palmivorus TaxID=297713 RepID=A0AAW0BVS8_9AGAR